MERLGSAALVAAALLLVSLRAHAEVQPDPKPITWKSCSSTIAAGGTAQNAPLTGQPIPSLRGFFLQNPPTATEALAFDAAGAASLTTSPQLAAGASVSWGPGTIFAGNLSVNGASTGHAFICQYGQ